MQISKHFLTSDCERTTAQLLIEAASYYLHQTHYEVSTMGSHKTCGLPLQKMHYVLVTLVTPLLVIE